MGDINSPLVELAPKPCCGLSVLHRQLTPWHGVSQSFEPEVAMHLPVPDAGQDIELRTQDYP